MKRCLVVIICFFFIGLSQAQAFENVYMGGSFSQNYTNLSYSKGGSSNVTGNAFDFYVGYRLSSHLKAEMQYIMANETSVPTDGSANVNYKSTAIFANLLYDIFTLQGYGVSFSPFVGAGLGLGSPKMTIGDKVYKKDGLAYQAQAGINLGLFNALIVSFRYSYMVFPKLALGDDNDVTAGNQSLGFTVTFQV